MEHRIQSILALWGLKLEALSTQCSILVTLKSFVHLEPDVQDVFPNSDSVNEALRFLIRITPKSCIRCFEFFKTAIITLAYKKQ